MYSRNPPTCRAASNPERFTVIDVARAWAQDQFEVWYQPQFDLRDGRLLGAEALVRLRREDGSVAGPGEFLHHVMTLGLMSRLGEWILRSSLASFESLEGAPTLSVNVCASQLDVDGAGDTLSRIVQESSFPTALVTLEVTEEERLCESGVENLDILSDAGIRISLDDFGTGYSGLELLSKLPFHEVKLDRSLVQRMGEERTASVCRAVTNLADTLGIRVVAEGLEEERHVDAVKGAGCTIGQGFHFGAPMPFERFAELWVNEYLDHTWLGGRGSGPMIV